MKINILSSNLLIKIKNMREILKKNEKNKVIIYLIQIIKINYNTTIIEWKFSFRI